MDHDNKCNQYTHQLAKEPAVTSPIDQKNLLTEQENPLADFQKVLEHKAKGILKKGDMYASYHVTQLCTQNNPILQDTYVVRAGGYISCEDTLNKLRIATSSLAQDIISTYELIKQIIPGDFEVIQN